LDVDHQVHDYSPGIPASGLFWTTRVSEDNVQVNLRQGTARLHVNHLVQRDYHDVRNSVHGGPFVLARVSFDIRWSGIKRRFDLSDPVNKFRGQYVENTQVTAAWSVTQAGFEFTSDPASTSQTTIGVIGHERNGRFFSHDDDRRKKAAHQAAQPATPTPQGPLNPRLRRH
jgi:hypothetical protein